MSIQAAALYALVGVSGAGQSVRDLNSVNQAVNKTQGVMAGLGKNTGQIATGFKQVGGGLLRVAEVVGVAAVGAVAASAKVGSSFQAMTELIHTQAGASQDEVEKMRAGIEAMVHTVGTSPEELAKGLYHIESVGLRGAKALDVLQASALGAKVGLADMESVTNALTAVTYSGIKGTKSAADAMAILDGIVGVGNMHLQDLTDSFKSGILGTAATFGVDLRSLGAAIATLTDAGVPASIAATRLNMTLSHMAAPVPKAIDTLKQLGISQYELANDLRGPDGIDTALRDLGKHLQAVGQMSASGVLTPQGADSLTKIFGGSRFGATAMQLLTNAMKTTADGGDRIAAKYDLITKRSQTFGDNVKKTMETAGFVWGQFRADIEESALAFSDGFLPALARAGKKFDSFLIGHHNDIVNLGKDLGAWVDKIDWTAVQRGANDFIGLMKSVLDVISKIPPQIDLMIVGFLGVNKVSGGLLGKGLENIVGGALGVTGTLGRGLLRGVLGKVPVVGGALAAATSTPVFVTNWPIGFGLGGGSIPGVGAAEGGLVGALKTGLKLVPWLAIGAIIAEGFAQGNKDDEARRAAGEPTFYGTGSVDVRHPNGTGSGASTPQTGGLSPEDRQAINDANAAFDTRSEGAGIRRAIDAQTRQDLTWDTRAEKSRQGQTDAITKLGSHLRDRFDPVKALHGYFSGIEKRSMEKYHWKDGKPPVDWVQGTLGRDLIRWESRIFDSHASAASKLSEIQHLERTAVANKDWGVAKGFKADIAALKAQAKADAKSARTATESVGDTIARKSMVAQLNATLNLKVDGSTLATAVINSTQFTREHNR